jgi:hypothetical protein
MQIADVPTFYLVFRWHPVIECIGFARTQYEALLSAGTPDELRFDPDVTAIKVPAVLRKRSRLRRYVP